MKESAGGRRPGPMISQAGPAKSHADEFLAAQNQAVAASCRCAEMNR
jgi:hypothetical protein